MPLKQTCKWFVISGAILIWIIKWILRPIGFEGETLRYFLNVAPNLFGSFLIPFGAYWIFSDRNFLLARIFRISTPFELRFVCFLGFCMLGFNEYLHRIPFFGRTFDYNDILFSSFGLILSCMLFGKIHSKKLVPEAQAG
jgi:hypothetical protein